MTNEKRKVFEARSMKKNFIGTLQRGGEKEGTDVENWKCAGQRKVSKPYLEQHLTQEGPARRRG